MNVRAYRPEDVPSMRDIWNQVIVEGKAFPQLELLADDAEAFFAEQSFCGVADDNGAVVGLYILHPNNVGRCGHISNASYAVDRARRGSGIGEALVTHCLKTAGELGFRLLQFNAVVASNSAALHLYEKLGFVRLGTVPGGFAMDDGHYEDICLFYHTL